jgi:hypothetical protein
MRDVAKDNEMFNNLVADLKKDGIEVSFLERRSLDAITGISYTLNPEDPSGEEVLFCKEDSGNYTVTVYLRDEGKPCFVNSDKNKALEEFLNQVKILRGETN